MSAKGRGKVMNIKYRLLEILKQCDEDRPLDRDDFAKSYDISERVVRTYINELRKEGHRICSSSDKYGYWMAKDDLGYLRFRREYMSRAIKIIDTVRAMDGSLDGQIGGLEN